MKNAYSSRCRLVCIIIFTGFTITLKAMPCPDTTTLVPANVTVQPGVLSDPPENNMVVYPKTLDSHKDETLDYIQKFSEKRREYLMRTYKTGKNFFPKITAVLNRFQLPEELKVLIALESGFNGHAISRAGALGYWQIMDDVAREYGLHISIPNKTSSSKNKRKAKDDRTNFAKSTLAAAKYLQDRCRNLNNNLLLIVASYNWGVGNVWKAMEKTGKSNPDFWDIKKYLPAETKAYVMNFITLNVIFNNYDKFVKNQLVFTPIAGESTQTAGETAISDVSGIVAD